MSTRFDSARPEWLEKTPEPVLEGRWFNTQEFIGWAGKAHIDRLAGWVDNPRIDVPVERFKDENFGREPNQEELLDIMLDVGVDNGSIDEADDEDDIDDSVITGRRRNRLLQLAENIRRNSIRIPLIVTFDGRILDGNRRFFASVFLARGAEDKAVRERFSIVPVWVLPRGTTKTEEDLILTELNSMDDCKVKWPYSVIARRVYRDYAENNMSMDELSRKYHNWARNRIRTVIEAAQVAEEFIAYHGDSVEARDLAYRKLIWFDELKRSNRVAMTKDGFRTAIYDLIMKPTSPFSASTHFRRLQEVYDNPDAWEVLTTREGKEALNQALFVVDRDRYEGRSDAQSRMGRVNSILSAVIEGPGFGLVDREVLAEFHDMADRVPGRQMDVEARVLRLEQDLDSLTSREIAQLPAEIRESLRRALERLYRQAESFRDEGGL